MIGTDRNGNGWGGDGRGGTSGVSSTGARFGRAWVLVVAVVILGVALAGVGAFLVPAQAPSELPTDAYGAAYEGATSSTMGDQPVPMLTTHLDATHAVVFLAAYSKYNDVSPLEHEVRSDIMGVVGAMPGIYFAQLVARTKRPESTVRYHTKILEREGELQTATILGNLRLFPRSVRPDAFAYLAAKREPATARVIDAIERSDDSLTTGELAAMIDRAPSTVSHHLARLEEESLIERTRDGESVKVSLAIDDVAPDRVHVGTQVANVG